MNKNIWIVVVVLVLILLGFWFFNSGDEQASTKEDLSAQVVDLNNSNDNDLNPTENIIKTGKYESYNPDKISLAENEKVVLFFHASWCPSCRALNSDIENNLSLIPEGVNILKTDYDKEVELKRKYGITTQHSLVQVDKDGNMIKKWSGGSKLQDIINNIQ